MASSMTSGQIQAALIPIAQALEADGYRLVAEVAGERVAVRVEATPEACEDCLVPQDLMRAMVADQLRASSLPVDEDRVQVTYPADH